jgi:hypothetical protein
MWHVHLSLQSRSIFSVFDIRFVNIAVVGNNHKKSVKQMRSFGFLRIEERNYKFSSGQKKNTKAITIKHLNLNSEAGKRSN